MLREWLAEAPFTLALSAGFFGFFAHAGALSALEEAKLLPARVTGSSAGALISGLWAGGVDGRAIEAELLRLKREDFWDPAPGPGLLRGRKFQARVESMLRVRSFAQARVPVSLSVWDVFAASTVVRSEGALAPAICASCAFPGMFQPVWMDGRPYLDGGIADRPGHASLAHAERTLFHHLPSKSPWRRQAPAAPSRSNMTTVAVDDLPRLGPFRLKRGGEAFAQARKAMQTALDLPREAVISLAADHAAR
jgi:NTE family protein